MDDPIDFPSLSRFRLLTVPRSISPPLSVTICAFKYLSKASGMYSSASARNCVVLPSFASFSSPKRSTCGSTSWPNSANTSSLVRSFPILSLIDLRNSSISSFSSALSSKVRDQTVLQTIGLADLGSRNTASPPPGAPHPLLHSLPQGQANTPVSVRYLCPKKQQSHTIRA